MQEYVEHLIIDGIVKEDDKNFLLTLFDDYLTNYDYYGLRKEAWFKLFDRGVKVGKKSNNFRLALTFYLEEEVRKYFFRNYNREDMRLLNNFLIKLSRNCGNGWEVLKGLYKELDSKLIKLDKQLIARLNEKSLYFKKLVKELHIESFTLEEIIGICKGEYDSYLAIKPKSKDLNWTITNFNRLCQVLDYNPIMLDIDVKNKSSYLAKLKFLLDNMDIDVVLFQAMEDLGFNLELEDIRKVIYNFSLDDLKELKNNINNLVYLKNLKEIVLKNKNRELKLSLEEEILKYPKREIYDYFVDIDGVLKQDKKEIVDYLLMALSSKTRRLVKALVNNYFLTSGEKNTAIYTLKDLVNYYDNWVKTGVLPNNKFKGIYGYFLDTKRVCKGTKKKYIDGLIESSSIDNKRLVKKFLNGKDLSKEEKKKLRFLIDDLNLEYHKILINELGSKDYEVFYEYFLDSDKDNIVRRDILDELLGYFNSYRRDEMRKYLNKDEVENEEIVKEELYDIRIHYDYWLKMGVLRKITTFKHIKVGEILELLGSERLILEWKNLSKEKKNVYEDLFNVIEYKYCSDNMKKEEYKYLMLNKLKEILKRDEMMGIEELFRIYPTEMIVTDTLKR